MKVKELIEKLENDLREESIYTLGALEDYVPRDIPKVADAIDPDNHRWYQIATDIYKCEDGFVGARGVNLMFSESMCGADCGEDVEINEYEPIQVTTYKLKL